MFHSCSSCGELHNRGGKGVPVKHTLLAVLLISLFLTSKRQIKLKSTKGNPSFSTAKLSCQTPGQEAKFSFTGYLKLIVYERNDQDILKSRGNPNWNLEWRLSEP